MPPNFSPIAPFYDFLARLVFGNALLKAQLPLLARLENTQHILIMGGGSGEILVEVLKRYPDAAILYLEASKKMLTLTEKRLHARLKAIPKTVSLRLGTETALTTTEQFDAVLTPFLLDLFPADALTLLMTKIDQHLKPHGLWLFTDFHLQVANPARWKKEFIRMMYLFFGVVSHVQARQLPDFPRHFDRLGYEAVDEAYYFHDLIQTVIYRRRPSLARL